jgi:hypothetical protein
LSAGCWAAHTAAATPPARAPFKLRLNSIPPQRNAQGRRG